MFTDKNVSSYVCCWAQIISRYRQEKSSDRPLYNTQLRRSYITVIRLNISRIVVLNSSTVRLSGAKGLSIRRCARAQLSVPRATPAHPPITAPLTIKHWKLRFVTCLETKSNIVQLICAWTAAAGSCLLNRGVVTKIAFTLTCAVKSISVLVHLGKFIVDI